MSRAPDLDPAATALVLIDLQAGVLGMPLAPYSGEEVVASARELAAHHRRRGVPVVVVTVAFPATGGPPVDVPGPPMPETMPPGWDQVADGIAEDGDIRIVKQGWGAFASTDLETRLREHGIDTIVLGGVATNFGVEETAREAVARGFAVVVASDASSSVSPAHHDFAIEQILPMIGRVRTVAEVVRGLGEPAA